MPNNHVETIKGTLGEDKNPLKFGNFQTQLCGAMSMGLLESQSKIAKTGAEITEEFTHEQKDSYKGQSNFILHSYNAAVNAAHEQAVSTRWAAYGDFASATCGIVGASATVREASRSEAAKKLQVAKNKLAQQNKLLDLAHKPSKPTSATISGENSAPATLSAKQQMVQERAKELAQGGAGRPRVLEDAEKAEFPQNSYSEADGRYYNEKATEEEVRKGLSTKGAYHIEGLDEDAIAGMTPDQRAEFVKNLNGNIKSTHEEISAASSDLQRAVQVLNELLQVGNSGLSGGSKMLQADPTSESRKDEADSQLAGNSGNIAAGIAQNANQAKEGAFSTTQNAMQSFGRVYDGMRG